MAKSGCKFTKVTVIAQFVLLSSKLECLSPTHFTALDLLIWLRVEPTGRRLHSNGTLIFLAASVRLEK